MFYGTLISLNSFLQGWLIRFAAYFSTASKARAAFRAEKSEIHLALSNRMTLVNGLQNLRSCGTRHKYWWMYPEKQLNVMHCGSFREWAAHLQASSGSQAWPCFPPISRNSGAIDQFSARDRQSDPATWPWWKSYLLLLLPINRLLFFAALLGTLPNEKADLSNPWQISWPAPIMQFFFFLNSCGSVIHALLVLHVTFSPPLIWRIFFFSANFRNVNKTDRLLNLAVKVASIANSILS